MASRNQDRGVDRYISSLGGGGKMPKIPAAKGANSGKGSSKGESSNQDEGALSEVDLIDLLQNADNDDYRARLLGRRYTLVTQKVPRLEKGGIYFAKSTQNLYAGAQELIYFQVTGQKESVPLFKTDDRQEESVPLFKTDDDNPKKDSRDDSDVRYTIVSKVTGKESYVNSSTVQELVEKGNLFRLVDKTPKNVDSSQAISQTSSQTTSVPLPQPPAGTAKKDSLPKSPADKAKNDSLTIPQSLIDDIRSAMEIRNSEIAQTASLLSVLEKANCTLEKPTPMRPREVFFAKYLRVKGSDQFILFTVSETDKKSKSVKVRSLMKSGKKGEEAVFSLKGLGGYMKKGGSLYKIVRKVDKKDRSSS